ncbi:hypothetical protein [Salinimonas chungwhensis]|uniref:hypothetical protein n=1 Tax=Salinimonas chungwhensis TaxID=265425 RepID=UPI000369CCCD|nr:hypothetical protein [Salinimonas chungwhensis]
MKYIGWAIGIIFAAMFTHSSLKEEGEEIDYVMDSMSFLLDWRRNQDYRIACHQESENKQEENAVSVGQIGELIDKGFMACALESRVGVPLGVGKFLAETAYVPIRAVVPYEMAKTALQGEKTKRCSDYIKPLIVACPSLLKPYFKRVEFIGQVTDSGNSDR